MSFLNSIKISARNAALELCAAANLRPGQFVVVGCSSSEILGHNLGSASNPDVARVAFDALFQVFSDNSLFLVAQCCEHLNRALIIERSAALNCDIVNVIPTPNAGGAFATCAYLSFHEPVAIESFRADAGLDIGATLIGMHLKPVAIPIRLNSSYIGHASVVAARSRPKLIGGSRAVYDPSFS